MSTIVNLYKQLQWLEAYIAEGEAKSTPEQTQRIEFLKGLKDLVATVKQYEIENNTMVTGVVGFVEGMRGKILEEGDNLPAETFGMQREAFKEIFSKVAVVYDKIMEEYA